MNIYQNKEENYRWKRHMLLQDSKKIVGTGLILHGI